MTTKYKFILDITAILISLVSLGLLIANQYYIASGAILIISFALFFLAYIHFSTKPITQKEVQYEYLIHDSQGKKTTVKKSKKLIANEKNITLLVDHRISGSGSVKNFKTNIGKIIDTKEIGGNITVYTSIDVPLDVNREFDHIIEYEGYDCFTQKEESIAHPISERMKVGSLIVTFPESRKPSLVKALLHYKHRTTDISKTNLTMDSNSYYYKIKKPNPGSIIELKWNW